MNAVAAIKKDLANFMAVDKFVEFGHLQPAVENSTEEIKQFVNTEMDLCCTQLLQQLSGKKPSAASLKSIVRSSIRKVEEAMLDTEDREFCYVLYGKIGEILGIDIEDKSVSMEQKLLGDLQRIAAKGGIDLKKFLPPDSPLHGK